MVSKLSIFFISLSLAVELLLPIGLAIFFYRKQKISIKAVFVGVLVFSVSQIVIRIPLLGYIQTTAWFTALQSTSLLSVSLLLGLSAGLFEEIGRYLGFRLLLKDRLERKNGIAFGIGHGGMESMYFGLLSVNNLTYSILINTGAISKLPIDQPTLKAIKDTFLNTSPALFGIAGLERIFAITIQIAFSLIVLYAVMNRKTIYLVLAVLLHGVVDSPLLIIQQYLGILWSEVFVALCAAAALVFIVKSVRMSERC